MHARLLAVVTLGAFAVAGCGNMTETHKGTATGAAIGTAAGAAIGAAAGAGGGYIWSKKMQDQKRAMEEATQGIGVMVTQTPNNELKLDIPSDISFDNCICYC